MLGKLTFGSVAIYFLMFLIGNGIMWFGKAGTFSGKRIIAKSLTLFGTYIQSLLLPSKILLWYL